MKHEMETVVNLLAPKEVGIKLVPLQYVENIQHSSLWMSIFLGISTSILGALISLHASNFTNVPVLWVLWLFLLIFILIFIVFSKKTYREIKQVNESKYHTNEKDLSPSHTETLKTESSKVEQVKETSTLSTVIKQRKYINSTFGESKELTKESLIIKLSKERSDLSLNEINEVIEAFVLLGYIHESDNKYKINDIDIEEFIKKLDE